MKAADILAATHQLEDTGMTRSQSEIIANTIIAAVEPLATREDLKAVKADIAALREETQTSFAALREDNKASIAALKADSKANLELLTEHLATKKEVESTKNYLLTGLLALYGILLAAAIGSALI